MSFDPAFLAPLSRLRRGEVVDFDEERGLGVLAGDKGERYRFHAVAIADGTRQIALGTAVIYMLSAGPLGELEVASLEPLSAPPPA